MKRYRSYIAALLTSALAFPVMPASADVAPPPSTLPNTFKAVDYGACTWDNSHDVGACINAAITAANTAGGGMVIVPIGSYGLSTTVTGANKVKVVGAGGANYAVCATALTWIGASSGVMAAVGSDASASQVVGAGLSKMCLDGATLAGTGLKLRSVVWSDFEDLYVSRVTANAYDLDVSSTANIGVMFNRFIRTYADLLDASSITANGWKIGPGTTTANTNRNLWLQPVVTYQNGTGFICGDMDSNEVIGAAVEPANGGTGTSLDLLGHASSALRTCRSNRFAGMFGVSGVGAVIAETGTHPSVHNVLYLDQESGAPDPTVNSGASLYWSNNNGGLNGGWSMSPPLAASSGGTGQTTLTAGGFVIGNGTAGVNTVNLIKFAGGCTLSNDDTTPNTVIDIAACITSEDSGNILMNQTSAYTKTTGAWTVGSGNGCLDTGSVGNSTWYYLYQIQRSDTGVVDYLCTVTYGSPTMPSNYGRKRYIGAIKTDGSAHIMTFTQTGDEFVWGSVQQDVGIFDLSTTAQLLTLGSVPSGHKVQASVRAEIYHAVGANPKLLMTSPDEADAAPDGTQGNSTTQALQDTATPTTLRLLTNTAQQVRARGDSANTSLWIITWATATRPSPGRTERRSHSNSGEISMRFYWPIAKVDAEQRMVWGYASTEAQDDQGETITRQAMVAALDDYMRFANIREMHQASAVGVATEATVDDKGLYLAARIVDDEAWGKVTAGVYKGFSIGGRVTARDQTDRSVITGLRLTEISVVDRPANPEAVFDCWKFTGEPVFPMLVEPVRHSDVDERRYARLSLDLGWLGDRLSKAGVGTRELEDRIADLQGCIRALAEGGALPSLRKRGEPDIRQLVTEIVPRLDALQRRVEDIARTPLPPQTLGRGFNALTKSEDGGGGFGLGVDAIVSALAGMSDEERTLALIKAAHAKPVATSGWLPRHEQR